MGCKCWHLHSGTRESRAPPISLPAERQIKSVCVSYTPPLDMLTVGTAPAGVMRWAEYRKILDMMRKARRARQRARLMPMGE